MIANRRLDSLVVHDTLQAVLSNQALHPAARDLDQVALELLPHLVHSIALAALAPDSPDLDHGLVVGLRAIQTQIRIAGSDLHAVVAGRGALQNLADRFNPERLPMSIDERTHF